MKFRKNEKYSLGGIAGFTYMSGVLLFTLSHWIRIATPVGEQHHPAEYWIRVLHTTLTYGVVLALGYLLKAHILPGLKSKDKRRVKSGVVSLFLLFVLMGTAIGIFYGGESAWSGYVAQVHSIIGIVFPAIGLVHIRKRIKANQMRSLRLVSAIDLH